MVGASKILTVSYGTFSCTLEGFDEPFSTMKAIAEYFRDLAADDRYFGAVPPTPDAEMLHRIAEREIHRRVEARVSEHGIVLRPKGATTAPTPPAVGPAAPTPVAAPDAPARPAVPESVAAKLARIRAVVNDAPAVAAAAAAVPYEEDEATADLAPETEAAETDFGFDLDFGDMPGLKAEAPAPVAVAGEAAPAVAEDEGQDDAAEASATVEDDEEFDEEERGAEAEDDDLTEALAAAEAAAAAEVAEEEDFAADESFAEEDFAEEEEAIVDADLSGEEEAEEVPAALSARVIRIARSKDDFDDEDDDEDMAAGFAMDEALPVADRTAAVLAALSDDGYDEAEFDDGEETEFGDDDAILAEIGAAIGDTGLPDDEEQALTRDLAEAARELRRDGHEGRAILESASEDDEASVERLMEEAKSKLEGPETRRRFSAIAHLKAAVAATVADRKIKSGNDGVAAPAASEDDTEAYRDDLSKAVRPRRPTSESMPTTRRPTLAARMAPLVLVSEQRVDLPEHGRPEAAVVRPRRVSTTVLETTAEEETDEEVDVAISPEDARSFAEFAERMGATSLPELLEAAAAYTATVEGLPHFSRPQIIKKVAVVAEDEDYSREDSLRSFGMLLRQGKIQKVRRGQFMLTDASRFMTEARRVAQ